MDNIKQKNKKTKLRTIDVVYVGLFTALIAGCAQIAIPMTIPFTLQTLAVCMSAGLLGWKRSTFSIIIYMLIGLIGIPVFSGFKGGIVAIAGPTGGYIIGFIFSAIITGFLTEKFGNKIWQLIVFMFLGLCACYIFGTVWFLVAYKATLITALTTCVVPFILPECAKIAVASVLSSKLKKHIR